MFPLFRESVDMPLLPSPSPITPPALDAGVFPGFAEIDAVNGHVVGWTLSGSMALERHLPADIRIAAIETMAEAHARTGRMSRPCHHDEAQGFLAFVTDMPIDPFEPKSSYSSVIEIAARSIGYLVFPVRHGSQTVPACTREERVYLAALREHWTGIHYARPLLAIGVTTDLLHPSAFEDYGLDPSGRSNNPGQRAYFKDVCDRAGVLAGEAYRGAVTIAARIGNQAGKDYAL